MEEARSRGSSDEVATSPIQPEMDIALSTKTMRSLLNKITDITFQKISEQMLQIKLLENPESIELLPTDKERMLPIVQTLISNVCVLERNEEAINIYVRAFCKLKEKWQGRQGHILMETTMSELGKFFVEYSKLPENEIDDLKRNKCFKLCRFISILYQENAISMKLIVAILQTFCKETKTSVEVFCKIFGDCKNKLMQDEVFMAKMFTKYKTFLETISKSDSFSPMYKFMCLNILENL